MLVDGQVAGSIMLPEHTLTIGPKATVKAGIKAKCVILVGTVEGNIEASDRVELRNCCSLAGDIRSPRIVIENGAYIKGRLEVVRESPAHLVMQTKSSSQLIG
jgi:cytoskeletal protein CcmA (bactofilin family)